jgi:hypothetical protein
VIWYSDLPYEEIWFVERDRPPWSVLAVAAFVLVSLIPVFALLLSKVRKRRNPLRAVGGCVLLGVAVNDAYLIAPPAGVMTLLTALVAVIGIGLGLFGLFVSGAFTFTSSREPADVR